jgi:penicillin amidase
MQTFRRILGWLGLLILVIAIAAGGLGVYTVRRSFPQTSGTLRVAGLRGAVDIYRDAHGIPHIYADTNHDLFFAQGYVHAQDRFYQMDFWRHQTAGRLSELYGDRSGTDKFLRTVGWRRVAQQEYASADPDTKAALDAFAEGVNAYLTSRPAADLSLEYSILGINGLAHYKPEPWSGVDTLAWGKAMAWDLGGNLGEEIQRAELIQFLGADRTAEFMPLFDFARHPVIVPDPAIGALDFSPVRAQLREVNATIGGYFKGIGSNNWVVAGRRTVSGQPLLANDPHLSIQMPAIWYQNGLHCRTVTQDCPYDVVGYSLPGVPAVIIGHNARIAWGVTNVGPDVQDLFIEKINPANPNQYEVNGQWVDMTIIEETITVKGEIKPDPDNPAKDLGTYNPATNTSRVTVTIRYTRHGPLITDVYGLQDFAKNPGVGEAGATYGVALRWTALDPGTLFESVFRVNRAQNFEQFREALSYWDVPSQNFVYADVDGNIGYQMPGNVPIRKNGDGTVPVPGWTDDYEWERFIPFDELPYSYNPPQGYIATANQAVVGPEYPYLISTSWDEGYRGERINALIEATPKHTQATLAAIQGDNKNLGAVDIVPHLLNAFEDTHAATPEQALALAALAHWDFQMHMDSRPAALYASFLKALVDDVFRDDVPEDYWPASGPSSWQILQPLLTQPDSWWWDDKGTAEVETRDDLLRRAWGEGLAALDARGLSASTATWGQLHTATFRNATLGNSGVAPIEALFNRGPFPTSGGSGIVNATSYNSNNDGAGDNPYRVTSVPSQRMVIDMGNFDQMWSIHTTGASGHAFHPNYIDQADLWRAIDHLIFPWSVEAVAQSAEAHLILKP